MKKIIALFILIVFLFMTSVSFADTPLKKLGRGFANILTCPVEIFYRASESSKDDGPVAGLTWGFIDGMWRMLTRGVVGIYEVVTFPIPLPANYGPIIDDPEFFLQDDI